MIWIYLECFNSIKVRLRPFLQSGVSQQVGFQFHKGTIKTIITKNTPTSKTSFNSIKVRLRPEAEDKVCHFHSCFNSIKVRLRPEVARGRSPWWSRFNSIKVRLRLLYNESLTTFVKFQFHKGTIKTIKYIFNSSYFVVSIP